MCAECEIAGCTACDGSLDVCGQCDVGLVVSQGVCVCEDTSLSLNGNGECELCNV